MLHRQQLSVQTRRRHGLERCDEDDWIGADLRHSRGQEMGLIPGQEAKSLQV